jgi:hypothetical protein
LIVFQTLIILVYKYKKLLLIEFIKIINDSTIKLKIIKNYYSLVLKDVKKKRYNNKRSGLDYHLKLYTDDSVLL